MKKMMNNTDNKVELFHIYLLVCCKNHKSCSDSKKKSPILIFNTFRFLVQLPELDEQGRRVYLLRGGLNDPNKIEQNEFNKVWQQNLVWVYICDQNVVYCLQRRI